MKAVKEHAVTVRSGFCDVALALHPHTITKISTVEPGWCSSRPVLSFWLHQSGWGWEPISRQLCGLKQCHIINYNGYKHTIKGQMRRHTVQKVHRASALCTLNFRNSTLKNAQFKRGTLKRVLRVQGRANQFRFSTLYIDETLLILFLSTVLLSTNETVKD
jgi:hypothetical protein